MEEAARTQQETLDVLGPTLRDVPGAELWYVWNAESANDPMSTEFIIPHQAELDRDGYYEDEYHLIINISFLDNPWFYEDESLKQEYEKDKMKRDKGLMSKSRFNWIWHGMFNDDVENGLIETDWFDACVDAHLKLGFEPAGAKVTSHDPADVGKDKKAVNTRHGVVFVEMEELDAANGNDGFDMACSHANRHKSDVFIWDCDGMGALLRNQAATNFNGIKIQTVMFKGSEGVHIPEAPFEADERFGVREAKLNKDVLRNKRAQNYVELSERMRKTYEAVEHGKYYDPTELISFSSKIPQTVLQKLRSELGQLPIKPNINGMVELYSKEEMRKGILMPDGKRRKIPSPNLADTVMMSFDNGCILNQMVKPVIPRAIRPMGRR